MVVELAFSVLFSEYSMFNIRFNFFLVFILFIINFLLDISLIICYSNHIKQKGLKILSKGA